MDTRILLPLACAALVSCGGRPSAATSGPATGSLVHLDVELERARVDERAGSRVRARAAHVELRRAARPSGARSRPRTFPGLAASSSSRSRTACGSRSSSPKATGAGMLLGGIAVDVAREPDRRLDRRCSCARGRTRAWPASRRRATSTTRAAIPGGFAFFGGDAGTSPVFNDGSVQDYLLPLVAADETRRRSRAARTLHSVGLFASAPQPATLDILSVTLVPRGAPYLEDSGVRSLTRDSITRRTIFAHAPASLAFRVRVPGGGRLDVGLDVPRRASRSRTARR